MVLEMVLSSGNKKLKENPCEIRTTLRGLVHAILLAVPFILMDVFVRYLASEVNYSQDSMVLPSILFSVIWILFVIVVAINIGGKIGRIVYGVCFSMFFVAFLVNCVYFPYTGFFFSFNLLSLAGEGSAYIKSTILNTSPFVYAVVFVILAIGIIMIKKFPAKHKRNFLMVCIVSVAFIILHLLIPNLYGNANDALKWNTWRNPRNVYENFNDSNKSIKVCGFYEYVARDFHVTFLKTKQKEDSNEIAFLNDAFAKTTTHERNDYTGIFEGKNLIFLQLEGLDTWLFNSEYTPNLYSMLEHSLIFNEHYSYYNGGGSTFNSEFAVNTGFITPISYIQNAYTFSSNEFTYSMPNIFKTRGYDVNVFHMNKGEYYSRKLNYQKWGYDNYYGLQDMEQYSDITYQLDRELILNETFYEKMFQQDHPFVHYLITYTPHMPYQATSGKGRYLAHEKYGNEIPELTEEECARMYAGETDKMIGLLMEALKENGLLENTVIVAYADHYMYTLSDKTILDKYKQTNNNLINKTPFFIWSYGLQAETFSKVNSQLDILPTTLNLFGIDYKEEHYIGCDIMDENYRGYAFFSDYSWYDGRVYVANGVVANGVDEETNYVTQMNEQIHEVIQKNDLVLKYDYFRQLKR